MLKNRFFMPVFFLFVFVFVKFSADLRSNKTPPQKKEKKKREKIGELRVYIISIEMLRNKMIHVTQFVISLNVSAILVKLPGYTFFPSFSAVQTYTSVELHSVC